MPTTFALAWMHPSQHTTAPAIHKVAPHFSRGETCDNSCCFFFFLSLLPRSGENPTASFLKFLSAHHSPTLSTISTKLAGTSQNAITFSLLFTHWSPLLKPTLLPLCRTSHFEASLQDRVLLSASFKLLAKHYTERSHVSEYWATLIILPDVKSSTDEILAKHPFRCHLNTVLRCPRCQVSISTNT